MRLVAERYCTWTDLENMTIDDVDAQWAVIESINDAARASRLLVEERLRRERGR
ncbi:MAG TPA: hypothetical protein VGG74_21275 [Kofleriaceae bacterium]